MLELDRTKIALENATNQLMALQHKQFVENRVYDDDETLANVENVPISHPETTDQVSVTLMMQLERVKVKRMDIFVLAKTINDRCPPNFR